MTFIQALLLGILQGATEFLPVSSSAHLVIFPHLLGWPDPGLAFDTLLHLGTLAAVVVYFRRDLWQLIVAAWDSLRRRKIETPQARLAWLLVLATLPGALLGFLFEDQLGEIFGMPRAAAAFLLVTAALLALSELLSRRARALEALTWRDALVIGLTQALAIVPGLSRSGATMATGLLLGYRREDAARFSFLLAIPIVLGGGVYQLLKLLLDGRAGVGGPALVGMLTAALAGYAAIAGLLALVRRHALWPFVAYCALLGLLVLTGILA
ncbi:MAG TPA: undecaprenyl-diphosphatase UppP [Anaerolineae bacterium]|nr:undecaprenyl-diphosphatase UppP [Anaerolineae bacterium]